MIPPSRLRTVAFTAAAQFRLAAALTAFAANSLLCRAALGGGRVDASTFTIIRIFSGAASMGAFAMLIRRRGERGIGGGSWISAFALFVYAAAFSFAYLKLGAAVGTLILFGSVQLTMHSAGILSGERPGARKWLGLALALAGLAGLTFPGLTAPDPIGLLLMIAAGFAWGTYSLRGRGSTRPLSVTADNLARCLPFVCILGIITFPGAHLSVDGGILAVLSGALATGVGYALWYAALPSLTATNAALVQLLVPVLAAFGAIVFLNETLTMRLALCTTCILAGVVNAVAARK